MVSLRDGDNGLSCCEINPAGPGFCSCLLLLSLGAMGALRFHLPSAGSTAQAGVPSMWPILQSSIRGWPPFDVGLPGRHNGGLRGWSTFRADFGQGFKSSGSSPLLPPSSQSPSAGPARADPPSPPTQFHSAPPSWWEPFFSPPLSSDMTGQHIQGTRSFDSWLHSRMTPGGESSSA